MIQTKTKTELEAQYRAVKMDSSSSLKEFSMDRKKYYKRYYLGEKVEDKPIYAAIMGQVVETLLLEPEEFDNRFYLSTSTNAPTGLMLEFVEALYIATKNATNQNGEVTRTMADMTIEAYNASGFKIKYEAVLAKFMGSDAESYYNEIRLVRSQNLTVVTTNDVSNAERIVNELKTNFVTSGIINLVTSKNYTVLNQLQVEGYEVEDWLFKSMMDKVVIDHKKRTIQVYDLKCTWSVEGFYTEYYLHRRSYMQAYLYWKAAESLTLNTNSECYGYTALLPQFIVCDSINYMNPLIYTLDIDDINDAFEGFEYKGRTYPGVKETIHNLKWNISMDLWNISRTNYTNNGVVNIKN